MLLGKLWRFHFEADRREQLQRAGGEDAIFETLTNPDLIINNVRTPTTGDRKAQERYVRRLPEQKAHMVVPTLDVTEEINSTAGTIPVGAKRAVTAYVVSDVPVAKVLFTKKTSG